MAREVVDLDGCLLLICGTLWQHCVWKSSMGSVVLMKLLKWLFNCSCGAGGMDVAAVMSATPTWHACCNNATRATSIGSLSCAQPAPPHVVSLP